MSTIITTLEGVRIDTAINVEDILIEPTDEYLAAHMPEVRDLFRMFYEAFVFLGDVGEYGELVITYDCYSLIYDAGLSMERFMQGKPLDLTSEERDEWDRWLKRDLERRRQPLASERKC